MKPTQAQIEAAAKIMFDAEQLARSEPRTESDCRVLARLALTTAAEVTDQQPDDTFDHGYKYAMAEAKDMITAAIERCAQAVKECEKGSGRDLSDVIAAIRALKDKP